MDLSDSLRFLERPGCPLCDEAWEVVRRLGYEDIQRLDVEQDDDLLGTYGLRIPVLLETGFGVHAEGHFDEKALRRLLKRRARGHR